MCCKFFFFYIAYGQQLIDYSGVVYESGSNKVLQGVSIQSVQSIKQTQTGKDGEFHLSLDNNDKEIRVSMLGYETSLLKLSSSSRFLEVYLKPIDKIIDEVVVTALGIKREERSLGYSVGKIDGESINNVAQENILGGMAGKVSGVSLSQTGGVGSSVSMVIRGATSLSSDNQPLFVVDGVPMVSGLNNVKEMGDRNEVDYGNPISDLNPDDIESVSVLKGPSAAALYGSRAGNGVVLITTKSGKKGQKTSINFSSSNVLEKPHNFIDFHYKYASGNRVGLLDESSSYWTGPELDVGNKAIQWNSPVDEAGNKTPTELKSYKNNMKNFLNLGLSSTNNVSVSGAGEKFVYRTSLNHLTHKGMIPNSDLFRTSFNSNVNFDINNNLQISSNIGIVKAHSNDMPATGNRGGNPLQAVYEFPHIDIRELKDYWLEGQEEIQQRQVSSGVDNPYFLAYALNNGFKRDRLFGNIKLDWKINSYLSSFLRYAENNSTEKRETKIPWSYSRDMRGNYHLQDLKRRESNLDFLVAYQQIKEESDFDISSSIGGNYMYQSNSDFYSGGERNAGLTIPGLYRLSNISRAGLNISNGEYKKAVYSLYGMANLSYKSQLYLDITARNDWSSTLPKDNRSYFYPSTSLSWIVSDTFNLPKSISLWKVRTGWAKVGNDTGPYQLNPVLGTGRWGDLIYMEMPNTLLNPQLKPEIATSFEYGTDFQLFKGRLRFEGTMYQVENKNQILSVNMPSSSGYSRKLINAGKLQSKGVELLIGGSPLKNIDGLSWDMSINFSRNRTKILELAEGIDYIAFWEDNNGGALTWVGEEVGNLYSRGYAMVKDPSSPYYKWPILDNNGKWIQDNELDAKIKVGNYNPNFLMGMQSTFTYKKLSLSFSLDWRNGGQFQSFTYRYGGSNWKSQHQLDKLIPGGHYAPSELVDLLKSNPEKYIIPHNGNFPRVGGLTEETGGFFYDRDGIPGYDGVFIPGVIAVYDATGNLTGYKEHLGGDGTNLYPASDQFSWNYNQQVTFDADYLKLRELSIGYDLKGLKRISNLRVSLFTRNIILWTKSKIGIDPERAFQARSDGTFRQGIELQNVSPSTIPFGFKLELTL